MSESASVRVLCRFRPINARERREFIEQGKDPEQMICKFLDDYNLEIMLESGLGSKKYTFDRVYPPGSPQRDVYNLAANDCVRQVLAGYNSCMMSYGQTGSGKTYTMQNFANYVSSGDEEAKGIIPRAGDHIFEYIASCDKNIQFNIRCSFLEIYNESVNDLLQVGPQSENLRIRESPERGIYVEGAVETQATSVRDLLSVIAIGDQNRAVSSTNMNAVSSRSHTIIIITVGQKNLNDDSKKEGKLCLVDLAGSEKTSKTSVEGQRLVEANNINQSLTTLGQCIKMLADGGGKGHIPYRQSKLTRLLQESLGGNSKTTLLIACSPHPFNRDETISTCEFGKRAKAIKNKVKVNAVKSVKELMAIIDKLTAQIQGQKQYIKILETALSEYKEKAPNIQLSTQIPSGKSLEQLLSNGQIVEGGESNEQGGGETNSGDTTNLSNIGSVIPHVDINSDPQMTITSLQIELERERKIRQNDKNGYEDDIASLKQQLKSLQDIVSGQNNLLDGNTFSGAMYGDSTGDQDKAFNQISKIQDKLAYYKQICIDHGLLEGSDDENTSATSTFQQNQDSGNLDENAIADRDEELKRRREGRDAASGKKVQTMQGKINALERKYEEQRKEGEKALEQEQEKNKQLTEYIEKLEKECNRLRGLGAVETEQQNLDNITDPQEKIIKQLEIELKLSKQALLQEIGKANTHIALQQQFESLQKSYRDQQCEFLKLKQQMQDSNQQRNEQRIKQLEAELALKNQQLHDRQARITNSNQRIELLKAQLLAIKPRIQFIQDQNQALLKQKQVDISKLQAQFNIEKQKFIGNLSQGQNIEKSIQGGASTLLNNNPDLISQIRKYKQNIGLNLE